MAAIEVRGLRKTYRGVVALDGLDLSVPVGGVFGFLGPNGAGKTTTIRALVGHLRASGSISVLGVEVPRALGTVIDRVGALVEQPSFFPGFSGRSNLELLARSRGFATSRVDTAIETVGLTERAGSRFSSYSLGMKQRLGVAAVLLKDPELLILDEPSNGLDPAGMAEMRTMIRRLAAEGRTVFVSSHLLAEIQQTCDHVAVVARGRCVASGSVADLLRGGVSRYRVRLPGGEPERNRAAAVLEQHGISAWAGEDAASLVVGTEADRAPEVTRVLAGARIYLAELSPIERTLEEAFFELTPGIAGSVTILRLVGTELRRFCRRRAVRWLVLLSLALAFGINVAQLVRSSEGTAYIRAGVPAAPEECRTGEHDGLPVVDQACLERDPQPFVDGVVDVYFAQPSDRRVRVGRTFEDTIAGLGVTLTLLGVLIGSTFLAAEFGAGGFGTQLLFEPRRWLLYAAKVAAVAIGCALVAVLIVAWTGLGQYVASALRGSTAGVDGGWFVDRTSDAGRVAGACALAAVCALAVGAIARRTVVAVGIFFGVVIATGFLVNTSWGRPLGRISPMNGLFALAAGDFDGSDDFAGLHTVAGALVISLAWAVGLSILAGWWLSRTEVR